MIILWSEDIPVLKAAITLTTAGDQYNLTLYDNNLLLDSIAYAKDWGGDDNGKSLEKIDPASDNSKTNWQESYAVGGTPGIENFTGNDTEPEPIIYSDEIQIDELSPNPNDGKEFAEFYNSGDEAVNLKGWELQDANLENKKAFCTIPSDLKIDPDDYGVFYLDDCDVSIALNNTGGDKLILFNPNQEPVSESDYADDTRSGYSYAFDNTNWQWTSQPSPGTENKFDTIEENAPYGGQPDNNAAVCNGPVCLNEILPNPKGDEVSGEYIEIFNSGDTEVDISHWILKDKSATKYIFPDNAKIEAGKYFVIHRTNFRFAMNNSGQETVSLLDADGKVISAVAYDGAKENVSYNFDGAFWHWSRFLTPGKANRFNHAPKIKLNKIKNAYAGVPVDFSASAKDKDKDKLKYVWDFGDGHKSYLKNPAHVYLKKKTYHVIFTVDDGSEKFAKTISVKVKNYPPADVQIVQLLPNPAGNDTGQETISLLNNSRKKINLKGWKIATGRKKLINHPINSDVFLNPNETREITHADAFFYLNNSAMKLELRYPNGKTADKLTYKKEKIAEGEIYKKINKQWAWVNTQKNTEVEQSNTETILVKSNPVIATVDETEIQNNLGKYSANPEWQKKKENQIVLANYGSKITVPKPAGRVLGAETVNEIANSFTFTPPFMPEKHWAVRFLEYILQILNVAMNYLRNRLNY